MPKLGIEVEGRKFLRKSFYGGLKQHLVTIHPVLDPPHSFILPSNLDVENGNMLRWFTLL